MDNNKLQEEMVADESRRLCNILNFQYFVLEKDKKDKKENKKSRPIIKNRKEFIENDNGDDVIDPYNAPDRYVKLREQFIKENYK